MSAKMWAAFWAFAVLNASGAIAFGAGRFGLSMVFVIASVVPTNVVAWWERRR